MFRATLFRFLVICLAAAAISSVFPASGLAVPVADGNWGIAKGDNVVTIYDTPLKEGTAVLLTLPAGTEFTAGDVQDNFVRATVQQSGQQVSGWVYARHLRTPNALRKLAQLGPAYTGYKLWTGATPSVPAEVSILRAGRVKPLPQFSVQANGTVAQTWPAGQPTESQITQVESLLSQAIQQHLIDRGWFHVRSDADWVLLIVCGDVQPQVQGGVLRVFQYGDLYLLNQRQKLLFFQRTIAGEGSTDEVIQNDFAQQAATEYAELAANLWPAPTPSITPIVVQPTVPDTMVVDPIVPILPPKTLPPKPFPIVPILPGPGPGPDFGPGPAKPFPGFMPIGPGPGPAKSFPGPGPGKLGPGPGKLGPGPGKLGPGPGKPGPPF